jgi:hydrogenase maturation protein HypF
MGTVEMIRAACAVSAEEEAQLGDPAAPIVLLRKAAEVLPDCVAPGQAVLGWMLPYTPLHHLLIAAMGGPLVMTSGNLSGEPQVIGNAEGFGDAPQVLAYGGQMKAAMCLLKNGQALLGHHLGELDEAQTWEAFLAAERDYAALFDHVPALVACDMHPGYRATQAAHARGLPVVEVQHHHAHMAACMAENGWPLGAGKVAGIVLDGLGLGPDGTVWGGEVLLGDYLGVERRGWLSPVAMPGGDMASREPWRNALAQLDAAGLSDVADGMFGGRPLTLLRQAVRAGVNAPLTSSAGRRWGWRRARSPMAWPIRWGARRVSSRPARSGRHGRRTARRGWRQR